MDNLRRNSRRLYLGLAFLTLFSVACFCTAPFASQTIDDVPTGSGPTGTSDTIEITDENATSTPRPPTPTAAPSGPTLTVSPSRGPSGTTATITLTGALPNSPVLLELDPGSTGQQTATATFEITGELEQAFNAITDILSDKGGHAEFIRMLLALILNVSPGSIVIEGPYPWVTVAGEVGEDGRFVATGRGTVAGFPDIAVIIEGTISMDHIAGEYTMGTEGGLPGGESITYLVLGDAEGSATALASDFFDLFNAAQGAADSARILKMLHPAVLELYGEAACTEYLATIVNPEVSIEVLNAVEIGEWAFERDGRTLPVADALSVQAKVHNGGDVSQTELHLAMRPDGTLSWFTDCGEAQG